MKLQRAVKKRIEGICKERGMSVHQLARRTGVAHSTIDSLLTERSVNPGLLTIARICSGIGMDLQEFFAAQEFQMTEEDLYD